MTILGNNADPYAKLPYGMLTNPALMDEEADAQPADAPMATIAPAAPQPGQMPMIRAAAPSPASRPMYQPNMLRQQQEKQLQQGIMHAENPLKPTGFWGKTGHILANVANAAGNVILGPQNMAMIPGTQQNAAAQHGAAVNELGALEKQDQADQQQFGREQLQGAQTHEAEARANSLENPPEKPDAFTFQQTDHGLMRIDNTTGEAHPVTLNGEVLQPKPPAEKEVNAKEQVQRQLIEAENKGDAATVKKLQQQLKDMDPMGQQRLQVTIQGQNAANQRAEETVSRQDVRAHDKAYVVPAEGVEKSYQMMDHAYQEYENARKQGKALPTGAQSMLALSTHLSTTFGNVKGARVTKDMIEHHLGARSISDSALVAVQKLTNGDVLSPDQWQAFHDLIRQSRNLSWGTAVKEAGRKHIPIDFLPKDLQSRTVNGQPYDLGEDGQFHRKVQ
jgi:hypothetical protein